MDEVVAMWPLCIVLMVCCSCGLIWNAAALWFYLTQGPKTSTIALIVGLSVNDTLVSSYIVTDIIDQFSGFFSSNSVSCKISSLFISVTAFNSFAFVFTISIDRYRKVCKPFAAQFTFKHGWLAVIIHQLISILTSIPKLFSYDNALYADDMGGYNYSVCQAVEEHPFGIIQDVYLITDGLICFIILGTVIYTYTNIAWELRLQNARLAKKQVAMSMGSRTSVVSSANSTVPNGQHLNQEKLKTETMLSTLMLIISVSIVLGIVPYSVIMMTDSRHMKKEKMSNVVEIGVRSVYLSSVINPIAICIFNPNFRNYVKKKKCFGTND